MKRRFSEVLETIVLRSLGFGVVCIAIEELPPSSILDISTVMAFQRRGDVAQAFRNNPNLQQFMLTDVTSTDRILGTGSYGSVVEVIYWLTRAIQLAQVYTVFAMCHISCSTGQVPASCLCWQEAP